MPEMPDVRRPMDTAAAMSARRQILFLLGKGNAPLPTVRELALATYHLDRLLGETTFEEVGLEVRSGEDTQTPYQFAYRWASGGTLREDR